MITSKSPRTVAMVALAAGKEAFSDYSHKYSPRKFTQPQLFACLVLKEFEKKDYRGVAQLLSDCSDLREAIGLQQAPHYTTLQKASRRLLKIKHVQRLLNDTVRRIFRRRRRVRYGAGDSSGFEPHHVSRYYVHRRDNNKNDANRLKKRVAYRYFGKLMLIVCCQSHAILAAVASRGPTPDIDQLDKVLDRVTPSVSIGHLVLDAGFDSGHNHHLLRDRHGICSTIPPRHGRPTLDSWFLPKDKYRRRMKTHFNHKAYRKRPQIETVFSMLKRNLGDCLRGKGQRSQHRDLYLRVLTHNIALALLQLFYRATYERPALRAATVRTLCAIALSPRPRRTYINWRSITFFMSKALARKKVRAHNARFIFRFKKGASKPSWNTNCGPNSRP